MNGRPILLALLAASIVLACGGAAPASPSSTPADSGVAEASLPASPAPDATDVVEPPDPRCTRFDAEGVFLASAGTLPFSLSVPGNPDRPWLGDAESFILAKGTCTRDDDALPYLHGALVGRIYADACRWGRATVEIPTAFDLVQELKRQVGHSPPSSADAMLGPFRATRLDVALPPADDYPGCDQGELRLWGEERILPGTRVQVHVAEVDGSTFVITVGSDDTITTPADLAEIESILTSLRSEM